MKGHTLRSRALVFALCAGAVAFFLSVLATAGAMDGMRDYARALIPAIVCAVFCWASAERVIAGTAGAIDAAIARLSQAACGDLENPIPAEIGETVPQLATAMNDLFAQLSNNLGSVQRLAMFDPVTQLPNRTHFRRSCERLLAEMPQGQCAALLFIDLDRFKAVNDTKGHAVGDILLGMVANRLRAVAERAAIDYGTAIPLTGRLAGDEFTMFLASLPDAAAAMRVGNGILYALGEPFELAGAEVSIGASVGIALRPDHGHTLTDLMKSADAAMYHAKNNGRGRAEYFTDSLAEALAGQARLESDLRTAIDADQFALAFQPQVSVRDDRIVAAEALLRWRHPEDGLRLPASFIACAEQTGLIVEIGDWVVGHMARTLARWADLGIAHRLAINVSQRQIDHATFFRGLRETLRAAGAPARLLELEISETLAMHSSDEVVAAIADLRADGATIAIDGFGTGYSNLARLRDLPVDRIKLDRSLIGPIAIRSEARTIVNALVGLIHGFGCEVVAEGVETSAQADILRILGVDVLQGYAIAAPMEEDAFLDWTREAQWATRAITAA